MPSSPDLKRSKSRPPVSRDESAMKIVSDRLVNAMSRRDLSSTDRAPNPAAVANPIEIAHQPIADSTFALGAAAPLPQNSEADHPNDVVVQDASRIKPPGGFDPIGSLSGTGQLARDAPFQVDHVTQTSDRPGNSTVPAITPPASFVSPDLNLAGVESADEGPMTESPVVRGGMLASAPDYAVTSTADPGGDANAHSAWLQASATGDDSGVPGNAGGGSGSNSGFDLSKTNELLGQILEALRKQPTTASTSLPAAGPSLYASRL